MDFTQLKLSVAVCRPIYRTNIVGTDFALPIVSLEDDPRIKGLKFGKITEILLSLSLCGGWVVVGVGGLCTTQHIYHASSLN